MTVSTGHRLTGLTLVGYESADSQGFIGLQPNSKFSGSPDVPSSYLGYAHFGTAAANGSLPTANLVGVDLLPIMGNTSAAPGSQGFTPPLDSGDYGSFASSKGGGDGVKLILNPRMRTEVRVPIEHRLLARNAEFIPHP